MICLRCGYCCVASDVVLPTGVIKVNSQSCPYLEWLEEKAICTLHGQSFDIEDEDESYHYKWEETPCGRHTQIERSNTVCRMGKHLRDKQKTGKDFIKKETR